MNKRTTISLEKNIVDILASYGKKGQTYNQIVSELLQTVKGENKC